MNGEGLLNDIFITIAVLMMNDRSISFIALHGKEGSF